MTRSDDRALSAPMTRMMAHPCRQNDQQIANAPGDEVTIKKADNHGQPRAEIKSGKVTYRIVGMGPALAYDPQ